MPRYRLEPKTISVLKEGYHFSTFIKDLQAGLVVGVVALPLAIAFAIASGVKPEQGLYTAIIAGFLISVFSGSRVQIGGPTGAFVVIIYGIIQKHGLEGLAIATVMAGIILVIMGFAKLGAAIKFIPYPVTVGFTSGIALLIFSGQIRDFLGLHMTNLPAEFIEKIFAYGNSIGTINPYAIGVGIASILILVFWPKITYKVPASLIVLVVMTLAVKLLKLPVETIGSRFGSVPNHLPAFALPDVHINIKKITELFPSAMTIAVLAGIESLLSAVVADGMTGRRHRSNMELIAQGIANIASPFFGGIPATGAIARTATNIKNGGSTPMAGIVHALTLALFLVVLGGLVTMIPLSALAAILIVVAYNMSEWHMFVRLFKGPRSDIMVLLTAFTLTVVMDLTVAIEVGIVLAAIMFMIRMSNISNVEHINKSLEEDEDGYESPEKASMGIDHVIPGVMIYKVFGTFFFGMADHFKDTLRQIAKPPKVIILRMQDVICMDVTALVALRDIFEKSKAEKTALILQGVHAQPLYAMQKAGYIERFGAENMVGDEEHALMRAKEIISLSSKHQPKGF